VSLFRKSTVTAPPPASPAAGSAGISKNRPVLYSDGRVAMDAGPAEFKS
jgi:hypothetical protein